MTSSWSLTGNAIIQGIAEPPGAYWAAQMQAYGTPIVAGVQAGRGGDRLGEIPIFDLVEQAVQAAPDVTTSILFNSPYEALDAGLEAIAAGLRQLILTTPDLPPLDLLRLRDQAAAAGTRILGPGGAGVIVPGKLAWGALATDCYSPGAIALLSRSHGLLDELASELSRAGLGQSLAVELGSGASLGSEAEAWLPLLAADPSTEAIVLIEQHLLDSHTATTLSTQALPKPLLAYITGQTITAERPPQEAATEIASQFVQPAPHTSTAKQKIAAYKKARVPVARHPTQLIKLLHQQLPPPPP